MDQLFVHKYEPEINNVQAAPTYNIELPTIDVGLINLQDIIEDTIGNKIEGGENITVTYNDETGITTIDSSAGGGGTWGSITGTLSSQTDLQTQLDGKANVAHTHVAANITNFQTTVSANTDVAANTTARHSHSNKALLDTYTQTEANLADAVTKKHTHANQSILNATTASFTTTLETKLNGISAGAEANVQVDWNQTVNTEDDFIKNKPTSFPPSAHTHVTADVTGLDAALADKVNTSRTISINGTTLDLTANRSWNVGDVLTSGTYSNPSWITSLAYSKLSGAPTNISFFTNDSAYITSSALSPYLTSATAASTYVALAGSYTNPSWLVSIPWSKITSAPSFITSAAISSLTDITLTSLASGNFLRYNGTAWVNTNLVAADIPSLDTSKITTGTFADARIASAATWNAKENAITAGTTSQYWRGDKTWQTLDKTAVGLSNVVNVDTSTTTNITDTTTKRFVTDTEKSTWNAKQNAITLTTTGTSGAATLVGSTLNIPQYSGGLAWVEVTGTTQTAAANTGYIANNASLVTITLPTTAAIGSIIKIVGKGAGGWRLSQPAGDIVYFGNITSTTGTAGFLASTHRRDSIELVCVTANTDWQVVSSVGNIDIN